ncbi:hypothetical protein RFI_35246 [Reticulomyxa filosa]|uniref:Uncharacterized protein n=1 Tax=Reticulomyxa filosa TaxID=46433 RepID=X6LN83_RETFI|nr:hypothetical protein RFI_35246 [Reticulomyxa filosa]|eukprot:ETO02190.1 hypothetical protein RFI_35246 [Reticulomyxa filosa]
MCLHILWNILKYPKHIKYRQIHKQALYNYLSKKCHTLGADFEKIFWEMEYHLQKIGFKAGDDDNWYYQSSIQLLHLWKCYQNMIDLQPMYFYIYIKQDMVFQEECVCYGMENGKIINVYLIMNIEQ